MPNDPYRNCEEHCNHDLARGVLISELLEGDGPYELNTWWQVRPWPTEERGLITR